MKRTTLIFPRLLSIAVLVTLSVIGNAQPFPVANSEAIFGEYVLSGAAQISKCPQRLFIKEQRPFVDIPTSITLPVSSLVFDGKPCAPNPQKKLLFDFGGDNDGLAEIIPSGTCLNKSVVVDASTVIPSKLPNGSFATSPTARFQVTGDCTFCEFTKPPVRKVLESFRVFDVERCRGRVVRAPIIQQPHPPKFFATTKLIPDFLLSVRAGVRFQDRNRVHRGSVLAINVHAGGKFYSVRSNAYCKWLWGKCRDWRRWPLQLLVPAQYLNGKVRISVFADKKLVIRRVLHI